MTPALRLGLAVAAVVGVLDQLSKWWVVERLFRPAGMDETPFFTPVRYRITDFFDLVMAWNRGVSFGVFNNSGQWNWILLSLLSAVIVAFLVAWMRRAGSSLMAAALGLVVGGAIGNVVDRLRFRAVADFLDFHLGDLHWPAFNLADSAITVGAVILVLDSLFAARTSSKN
jgi:signal peptidase II